MLKTALNTNIIPHIWKLANIVTIPKPNKDIDKGTSYRPISLLSVVANTLEKSLLPYLTANLPNTPTQHGYKTQHSTVTALHTVKKHRSKGVQPNGFPCANNHCSTRYEQSFRHNKHTHTYQKAATDQHSRHNHQVHKKLHQGTQSLHNIYKSHILTTSILNWRSTRWRPFTNTIQHIHCRHTTTKSTSSGYGLRR